ncbi:pre-rRNA-processing protein Pno1p [Trichomonascus vanleenenianus]|uniref:Pno1p n=1 Tax=Trichomonascus vanleenenianus TaxID=2268995 RepID=UPI003ECB163C
MSAPTARIDKPEAPVVHRPAEVDEDEVLIDASSAAKPQTTEEEQPTTQASEDVVMDEEGKPRFGSVADKGRRVKLETRSIQIPPHRVAPLKTTWRKIYPPLVDHLKLQVKFVDRAKDRRVMIRTCKTTTDPGAIQKGEDFIRAFTLGFDVDDAIALLRLDDLYIETFEVKDVKTLTGDHLSRAIGRIAGKDGKTKFAIENASRTRVVLADSKIHILGGFNNIKIARETIVSLILGAPPGKVYGNLRTISSRMKERF